MANGFLTPEEETLNARFLANGHLIVPAENPAALGRIRRRVAERAADALGLAAPDDSDAARFLEEIGRHVDPDRLNPFRLAVYTGLNANSGFRQDYYALAAKTLATVVGNELAMQRRVNLSIQLPGDNSSLLPIHADVWSGDSPYEVVLWLPLVDCYRTRSMYLVPPAKDAPFQATLARFKDKSAEDLFKAVENDAVFLDVPYGNLLVFSQNLMHGNRVNRETGARWSMNCRFKGLFTPYADKKLGEFFEPITLRAATRLGMNYRLPEGFDD